MITCGLVRVQTLKDAIRTAWVSGILGECHMPAYHTRDSHTFSAQYTAKMSTFWLAATVDVPIDEYLVWPSFDMVWDRRFSSSILHLWGQWSGQQCTWHYFIHLLCCTAITSLYWILIQHMDIYIKKYVFFPNYKNIYQFLLLVTGNWFYTKIRLNINIRVTIIWFLGDWWHSCHGTDKRWWQTHECVAGV